MGMSMSRAPGDEVERLTTREQLLEEGAIRDEVLRIRGLRLLAAEHGALRDPDRGEGLAQRRVDQVPAEVLRLAAGQRGIRADDALCGHEPGKARLAVALGDPLEVVPEVQRPGQIDLRWPDRGVLPVEQGHDLTVTEHGVRQAGVAPDDPGRALRRWPPVREPFERLLDQWEAAVPAD